MKWLKEKLFRLKLKKKVDQLESRTTDVVQNETKHIAVLFDESQIDSLSDLNQYLKQWKKKGKNVESFSFVDIKEFPEGDHSDNKFCRKDLNWYQVPAGDKIDAFLSKKYDILITINPGKKEYLHFLNAASSAKFKIGLLPDELEFYNLILDCQQPEKVKNIFTDIQSTLDKLAI